MSKKGFFGRLRDTIADQPPIPTPPPQPERRAIPPAAPSQPIDAPCGEIVSLNYTGPSHLEFRHYQGMERLVRVSGSCCRYERPRRSELRLERPTVIKDWEI